MVAMIRLASARCDDVICCVICTTESMATSGLSATILKEEETNVEAETRFCSYLIFQEIYVLLFFSFVHHLVN